MYPFNPALKLTQAEYIAEKFSSANHLSRARLTAPTMINSAITYAYGSDKSYGSVNFPLLFYTQGMGRKQAINSVDLSYQAMLFGKPKKTSIVSREIVGQVNPGKNWTPFKIAFGDRWFQKNQTLVTGGLPGYTAQVVEEPYQEGGSWIYTLKLYTSKGTDYLPTKYVSPGAVWGGGAVNVATEHSRGTETRSYTPYKIQNQLSVGRKSYNIAGNAANKKMSFSIKVEGRTINAWTDWERYLGELSFKEEIENDLIFSKYNKTAEGYIMNTDADSGLPVPKGMGIWDMIPNTMTYGRMTEKKIDNFLQDVLHAADAHYIQGTSKELVVMGGIGLMTEIDRAFKNSLRGLTLIQTDDKFVRTTDGNLQFGGYFTSYRHRSGKIIKFVHHPLFDNGIKAQSMDRHPIQSNFSMLSYCGMVLDFSLVDAGKSEQSNILFTYEEGREYKEANLQGMAQIPNSAWTGSVATDVDASATHAICTHGVHLNYPATCFKIVCSLS